MFRVARIMGEWASCLWPVAFVLMVSACASNDMPGTITCTAVKQFTHAEQHSMALALYNLPADNPINDLMAPDWQRMRDESRACANTSR